MVVSGAFLLLIIPLQALAQNAPQFINTSAQTGAGLSAANGGFFGVVAIIKNGINVVLPVIISLAVLYLLWGIFQYVKSNDTAKQEEARGYIIWSLIALAVMVSVWGLVNILTSTLNLDKTAPPPPPIPEYANY